LESRTEERDELFIQALNHIRHDWMNDSQVLYGYLKLKKYDKMHEFMETIKEKTNRESGISRLGNRSLILYLNLFRVRHRSTRLEVELDDRKPFASLPLDHEEVASLIINIVDAIVTTAGMLEDCGLYQLCLSLMTSDGGLTLRFEYTGGFELSEMPVKLQEALQPTRDGLVASFYDTYYEDTTVISIVVPFDLDD